MSVVFYGRKKCGYVILVRPQPDRPLILSEGIDKGLAAAQIAGGVDDPMPAIALRSAEARGCRGEPAADQRIDCLGGQYQGSD